MVISLEGRRRWLFSASMIVFAGVYLFLAVREFAASVFAARPDRELRQADKELISDGPGHR